MRNFKDLRLDHLWVVYPGSEIYQLHERVTAVPIDVVDVPVNMPVS